MSFECKSVFKKRKNLSKVEIAVIRKLKNSTKANWMVQ